MIKECFGYIVKIPSGYKEKEEGIFVNGHGVEYQVVKYGWKDSVFICLETIYSKHVRTVELEITGQSQ